MMDDLKNRNACAVQNGFQFQTAAAISLLVDHLDDFDKIKNEGVEDIVIVLQNKSIIYAQAKSTENGEPGSNVLKNYDRAIEALNEDLKREGPVHQLVYITNVRKLFGSKTYEADFINGQTIPYDILDINNKNIIKSRKMPDGFDLNSFAIQYLMYKGVDANKEKWIIQKINDKFNETEYLDKLSAKKVFQTWKRYLDYNSTNKNEFCNRTRIAWGMILNKIDAIESSIYRESEEDYGTVHDCYDKIIDRISDNFEVISQIIGDYEIANNPVDSSQDCSHEKYAETSWQKYAYLLDETSVEEKHRRKATMFLIQVVLGKMGVIRDITRGMKV